jgi:hypothetical protein
VNNATSDESKLAQEAVARIRSWLKNREEASRELLGPRLALKFCGGCNPCFDRRAVAQLLLRGLTGVQWVSPSKKPDLLIILNGCFNSCAERPEVQQMALLNLTIHEHSISPIKKRGES